MRALQELLHRGAPGRKQGSSAFVSTGIEIRPALEQQRGNPHLIAIYRPPQRSFAEAVARLDIRTAIEQRPGDFHVVAPGRHVQRRAALGAVVCVHAGA